MRLLPENFTRAPLELAANGPGRAYLISATPRICGYKNIGGSMLGRSAVLRIIALVLALAATGMMTAASAQDSTASHAMSIAVSDTAQHVAGLRSPTTAAVLGTVLPGAGLAYAGQWGRGAGTYFGAVGGIGLGLELMYLDRCTFTFLSGKTCNPGRVWPQRALGVAAIGTGVALWAYGAIDAPRIVRRNNARKLKDRRTAFGSIEPMLFAPGAAGDHWGLGIHATW